MKNTVADLIRALQALPDQSLEVQLEGCDCYGGWDGEVVVEDYDGEPYLLITRDHS